MKLQHMTVRYFINDKGVKTLCYNNYDHRNHNTIGEKNDIFKAHMKIHFSTKKALMIESLVDGTMFPVFKSEFKRILDNCSIVKGVIAPCEWAVRSHGGLYSLQVVI